MIKSHTYYFTKNSGLMFQAGVLICVIRAGAAFMRDKLDAFLNKYFDPELDLRVQAFTLLAMAGVAVSSVTTLVSFATGVAVNGFINLGLLALSYGLLRLARAANRYDFCCRVSVVVIFIIAFTAMFFTAGGYHSAMPSYFIFALVFTALLLNGRERAAALAVEFFLYTGSCLLAYFRPGTVTAFATEADAAVDIITGFAASSGLLLSVILLYIRIYNNRQKRLEALDRLKTEFYQDMQHEMKSPLTIIATGADYADRQIKKESVSLSGTDLSEASAALGTIRDETFRLGRMVESMVDMASMNNIGENRKRVNFAALLAQSAGAFRPALEARGVRLRVEIAPCLPDVFIEHDRFTQVVSNLLSNAAAHTAAQGGEITVTASSDGAYITARVHNTGEGIEPELLPRVFERGVSGRGGTGYGLYICKTVAEAHGGAVKIESAPGRGTAVTFTVPVYGGQEAGHRR
jgi:signal transduction histidine kinase